MIGYRDENSSHFGGATIEKRYSLSKVLHWVGRWWPKRTRYRVVLLVILLVLLGVLGPYVFSRATSRANALQIVELEALASSEKSVTDTPVQLRIVAYNIAHGRGLSDSNWEAGTDEERLARLEGIADLLKRLNADVVVLNEVDFDASWSNRQDQAVYLAAAAGYRYCVQLRNLDFQIGLWRWRFGNAVLSRHPVSGAREIAMPAYARWEAVAAGKKRALFCEIDVSGQTIGVVAAHLSHRSENLRAESAERLVALAKSYPHPLIIAGDLNSAPTGFPGHDTGDNGENAMDVFAGSGLFQRRPDVFVGGRDVMTFSADDPRKIIDWVLVPKTMTIQDYRVEASVLSDHHPVIADVAW